MVQSINASEGNWLHDSTKVLALERQLGQPHLPWQAVLNIQKTIQVSYITIRKTIWIN